MSTALPSVSGHLEAVTPPPPADDTAAPRQCGARDGLGAGQVGDGARELEDAMEGAGRELQALGGGADQRNTAAARSISSGRRSATPATIAL